MGRNVVLPAVTGCPKAHCNQRTARRGPPPPAEMRRDLPPPPPPPRGVTFMNANITSLRAHYETAFNFSSDFETEPHIFWECDEWAAARDLHIANVRALGAKVPDLPPFDRWPPCLKICSLLPEIEPLVNKQVEQHDLPFIQALHAMFVAILAVRKLRDQQAPKLFPTVCPQARSAHPYHQLVGPMPPLPRRARLGLRRCACDTGAYASPVSVGSWPSAPGMPTQPHRTHLAMGKALSGRPTGLGASATVDGRHRHTVFHRAGT